MVNGRNGRTSDGSGGDVPGDLPSVHLTQWTWRDRSRDTWSDTWPQRRTACTQLESGHPSLPLPQRLFWLLFCPFNPIFTDSFGLQTVEGGRLRNMRAPISIHPQFCDGASNDGQQIKATSSSAIMHQLAFHQGSGSRSYPADPQRSRCEREGCRSERGRETMGNGLVLFPPSARSVVRARTRLLLGSAVGAQGSSSHQSSFRSVTHYPRDHENIQRDRQNLPSWRVKNLDTQIGTHESQGSHHLRAGERNLKPHH